MSGSRGELRFYCKCLPACKQHTARIGLACVWLKKDFFCSIKSRQKDEATPSHTMFRDTLNTYPLAAAGSPNDTRVAGEHFCGEKSPESGGNG